jgi:hypothetical protein
MFIVCLTFNDLAQQCSIMEHVYSQAGQSLHFFSIDIVTTQIQGNLMIVKVKR